MSDDGQPLTLDQVRAAATVGRLPQLAQQLVADRRWSSLEILLTIAATPTLPLDDVAAALESLLEALSGLGEADRKEATMELKEAQKHAAAALARRLDREPLTEETRRGMRIAAGLFASLGEPRRAAELYEKAGDDAHAAEAWGALGDLDRMEACLGREEDRRGRRLAMARAFRAFDTLGAGGQRLEATRVAEGLDRDDPDAHALRERVTALRARLCRGGSVALRLPDGSSLRVATLPAAIGRDPGVEIPVREPTVSRRHARLRAEEQTIVLEDAGSRGGTFLGELRVAGSVPLPETGLLRLGTACVLRFSRRQDGGLLLEGTSGLDRPHRTLVGRGAVVVDEEAGFGRPISFGFSAESIWIERPLDFPLEVGGGRVGPRCDLLHGDHIRAPDGRIWEVL